MSENDSESIAASVESLPEGVKGYRRDGRRVYERGFRERVARECRESGRSLSSIALHYGINPNLVRRWVDQYAPEVATMLPVSLSTLPSQRPTNPKPSPLQRSVATLSIQVDGVTVSLDGHIDAMSIEAVVRALATR